ncbi:MAG: DNA repair and recombination protein RadA [Nitrososphaerales archaeon]
MTKAREEGSAKSGAPAEDEALYMEVDELTGIGPAMKTKLNTAGIVTIVDLASKSPNEIADVLGSDLQSASDICENARQKLVELNYLSENFVSATEIYRRRKAIERISTGSLNLDDLLAGGIETKALTEFYGEFGSGKTQICHTMCAMVQQQREEGGLVGRVVYIDTENTFRPERIVSIAEARGYDPQATLDGIIVAKAYNSSHQELIVSELGEQVRKNKVRLVIVDSAVAHYRAEFIGRGTLSERQQKLNKFMHALVRAAEIYNLAVVATNQVQASPDSFFSDPTRATGGHVVAHTSTYRVYIRKSGKSRIARIVDSPYHAEREAVFVLDEKGVDDPQEEGRGRFQQKT